MRKVNGEIKNRPSERLHVAGADNFHINGLEQGPVIDRCESTDLDDDCLNIHGRNAMLVEKISDKEYIFSSIYGNTRPGDPLEFFDAVTLAPLGKACLKKISEEKKIKGEFNRPTFRITLDKPLKLTSTAATILQRQNSPGFTVRNCWFHDSTQRTLINGAPDGLIENTTIMNTGGGLHVSTETYYGEGPFASNMTIKGNRFIEMLNGIDVSMFSDGRYIKQHQPVKNLVIRDNYFEAVRPEITLDHIDGVTVENNSIDSSRSAKADTEPYLLEPQGTLRPVAHLRMAVIPEAILDEPIYLAGVTNGKIEGNFHYDPKGLSPNLVHTGVMTGNIKVDGKLQPACIADTVTGWDSSPAQGLHGWYYGFAGELAPYKPSAFKELEFFPIEPEEWINDPEFAYLGGQWRDRNNKFAFIEQTLVKPSKKCGVIKRWQSSVAGKLEAIGAVSLVEGGKGRGIFFKIYVDGKLHKTIDLVDNRRRQVEVQLEGIKKGSKIDFMLAPKKDACHGLCTFEVKIISPDKSNY